MPLKVPGSGTPKAPSSIPEAPGRAQGSPQATAAGQQGQRLARRRGPGWAAAWRQLGSPTPAAPAEPPAVRAATCNLPPALATPPSGRGSAQREPYTVPVGGAGAGPPPRGRCRGGAVLALAGAGAGSVSEGAWPRRGAGPGACRFPSKGGSGAGRGEAGGGAGSAGTGARAGGYRGRSGSRFLWAKALLGAHCGPGLGGCSGSGGRRDTGGAGRGWWLLLRGNSRCHRGMGVWGDTGAPPAPRGRTDTGVGHPGYALPSPCWLEGPVGVRAGAPSPPEVWGSCGGVEPPPVFCVLPCLGVPCGHGAPCVPHPGLGMLWMFRLLNTLCPLPGWRSHVRPPDSQCLPSAGGSQGLLRASPAKTEVPAGLGESLPFSASV